MWSSARALRRAERPEQLCTCRMRWVELRHAARRTTWRDFPRCITPGNAPAPRQVHGAPGLTVLSARIAEEGVLTLWSGALATSFATFAGRARR